MKRSSSPGSSSEKKRAKLYDASLGLMEEQTITDMVQHGPDSSRCITGKFKLTWALLPGARKLSTIATVQSDSREAIFPIDFEIALEDLSTLKFSPTQEFTLSLKGAKLQRVQQNPKPCNEEFKLIYSEGVEVQWGHSGSTAPKQYLNTWTGTRSSSIDKLTFIILLSKKRQKMCTSTMTTGFRRRRRLQVLLLFDMRLSQMKRYVLSLAEIDCRRSKAFWDRYFSNPVRRSKEWKQRDKKEKQLPGK